ncbi:hypothetical protein HGRIS_002656 [Hohenbuehelia grisea]|uniref:Mitochondrial intermembrane space import and assembly protein 40 n=1 Tax=Hohenbuehelia grisea TaxID=104357 RepID=A0ABR3JN15_9AGAR
MFLGFRLGRVQSSVNMSYYLCDIVYIPCSISRRNGYNRQKPLSARNQIDALTKKSFGPPNGSPRVLLMLTRFARLPLRRCLHTASNSQPSASTLPKLGFAVGATTVVASYLALRFSLDSQKVALDGPATPKRSENAPLRYPTFSDPHHVPMPEPNPLQEAKEELDTTSPADATASSEPSLETSSSDASSPVTDAADDAESSNGAGQSAYNPITGEINWDCPCLGGMAHGPCGQQFRDAFSCFVTSEDEPKGINCVDKFKAMQNCFREHPEVYADELMDEDDEEEVVAPTASSAPSTVSAESPDAAAPVISADISGAQETASTPLSTASSS